MGRGFCFHPTYVLNSQHQVKNPKLARRDRGIGAAKAVHGVFDMPLMPVALVRIENVEVTAILHQHGGAAPSGWVDNDLGKTWLANALSPQNDDSCSGFSLRYRGIVRKRFCHFDNCFPTLPQSSPMFGLHILIPLKTSLCDHPGC